MDYKIAQQLKDTGFPQVFPKSDFLEVHDAVLVNNIYKKYPEQFNPYRPTLEELIDACGDCFTKLERLSEIGDHPKKVVTWYAVYDGSMIACTGKTQREAVARLWLVLNKK